jgi:hypothetical protein
LIITWSIPEPVTEVPEKKNKPLLEDCLELTKSVVLWYKANTIPATDMKRCSQYIQKRKNNKDDYGEQQRNGDK